MYFQVFVAILRNAYNLLTAERILKINSENGYFNIMSVHAGLEHVNYPAIEHIRAARNLADVKPFVYYGHHPHVIQGVEQYNNSLIAHSLGNFCFDDVYINKNNTPLVSLTENNRTGLVLELEFEDNVICHWKEQPVYIAKDGKAVLIKNEDFLEKYNEGLSNCESDLLSYVTNRKKIIEDRIQERKNRRDIKWYLQRLRFRYVRMILNGWKNEKEFNKSVKQYIK